LIFQGRAGFFDVKLQKINLAEMLAEIIDLMQIVIEEKQVEVNAGAAAGLLPVISDTVKLRQIIQNLVDNAVQVL
jgi:signal transduction histidine kinase